MVVSFGKRIPDEQLLNDFPSPEGVIEQIYGRIGQGKTYLATASIIKDLERGIPVYANWQIDFSGYDQRQSVLWAILGVFGLKRKYYKFDSANFHYVPLDDDFIDRMETLTDCKVYLDEGHLIFDAYQGTKMSLRKRAAILHTRHFNRSIIIVSQRPTAIHVSARGNVNRFLKCERLLGWPVTLFRMTEFQDMVGETVDEEQPLRSRFYFGSRRIFKAYNSKYLRGGVPVSQKVYFEAYRVGYLSRWLMFIDDIAKFLPKSWTGHAAAALRPPTAADKVRSIQSITKAHNT